MSVRIALFGALVLLLSGCASYDNGYRDGAYYRSSHGDEGDYYYGRPQQRSRGYYDPFYDPFYGPYYGPYRSPLYYPYRYYPYYGPYRPYRSGFGFEYNYGYGGYGGYGYPSFGFGYSHSSGGDRRHDRDHRDRDDHFRDRDRNADRDADRERDRGRDQYRRPDPGSARPWPQREYQRIEPNDRGWARDGRRERVGGSMPGQADFQRNRAPALRMPSGGAPVVQMRRAEPAPDYGKHRGGRGGAMPTVRSQPQTALPGNEKSRNESQKHTSALEKER